MEDYTTATRAKVADAVKVILAELNGGNRKRIAASIYSAVAGDHRTLQQAFWSAVLLAQIEYASEPFDGRNEQAVKLANRVKEMAVANNYDMGLAYI